VSYSVHFRVELASLPEAARDEIRGTMDQVADALDTVPEASPFWISMKDSVMQIDVTGFRVVYRVDPVCREILVVELAKARR
jgi:mRNA-degrading endonuclease RelE of RelBE toxin-antitoxin system